MRIVPRLLSLLAVLAALPLHAAISGSVMNSDGMAIAGAKVSVFAPETLTARRERLMSKTPARQPLVTATTDGNGNFRIEPPKDAPIVDMRIDAAGYAPDASRQQSDDEAGAIILIRAEPKSGTIRAGGKGIAGATVTWAGGAEYTTTTDENGRYTAPDPSKWANRLIVTHPDYARIEESLQQAKRELDRTLTAGVKISGKVVAEDGTTGVGDAAIVLDGWPMTKSGPDGAFAVEHAPKDWSEVHAISGSRIAARASTGGTMTLKLAKGATVTGNIKDMKSQLPVAGAEVMLTTGGGRGMGGGFAVRSTVTDAKGNFSLSPLPPGSYGINPNRPNYNIPSASVSVTAGQSLSKPFYATALARVSGVVVDEDKKPVAAARVASQSAGREGGPMMFIGRPQFGRTAASGPDGRYVLRVAELDADVQISAAKKGYPATKSPIMRLASGERKGNVTLTIPRGVAFSGRVIDRNGKPVSGVSVDAAETQGDMGGMVRRMVINAGGPPRGEETVTTASDGTFNIRLKEGKYDVVFKREGYAAKTLRTQTVAQNEKPVEVTLEPGVEIAGRVVRGGVGVEGVNVTALSEGGMAQSTTGPDGSFTLADLTPGQMMINVNKMDAMIQEMRPVTAPARDLVIELPAGGRITGRVVDKATHRPLTSFQAGVSTSRGGGGMMIMMPPMMRAFTSDDGTFVLENVKPGPTQVMAMAPGYTTGRAPNVEVKDGETVSDVEVALEAGAKLVGKVTDANGAPVAGVSVRPEMMGGPGRVMRFDGVDTSAVTDPSGEYTMESLEPGEKTFNFARSGYVTETKTVTLASGKDTRLDVTIGSGLRIAGVVVTEGGAPVGEATVRASSAAGGGREAHTDASGSFQLEGLAPGHYTFTAAKSGLANGIVRDVDIAVTNNVRITMKSGSVITGHVTGLAANELEQTTIMASSPTGSASAPVDSAGNFRIEGSPTGTVRVSARMGQIFGGTARSAAPKTVQVEPGSAAQVDIEFQAGTVIRGRVTRNNQPVPNASVAFMPRQGKAQTNANTTADASGRYEVNGLEDGPYTVQVMDMERLTPFTTTYDVRGSGNFDIDVRTASLRGRVLDASTGSPIAEAQVDVRPTGSDTGFFGSRVAMTDSNGTFVVDSVAKGSYQISADKQGYGHELKQISVDDTPEEIELKLQPSAGVTLKVVDGRDGRLLGANVRVTDLQGHEVGGDGGFRFFGGAEPVKLSLAPGSYRATIQAMGYAQRTVMISSPSNQTVALTPGGTLLLRSKSSSALRGRLTDSSGYVYMTSAFNPTGTFRVLESPGTTTLQNVAPGHYRLDVLDTNDQVLKTIQVDVVEGQSATYDV